MDLTKLLAPVQTEMDQVRQLFTEALCSTNAVISQVVGHVSQRHGKMMRPMLLLLTAKMLGDVKADALHAAVSLELLHTASLIHDDVVDESDQRRGQASVNAMNGNKVAVLSGDFFLASALCEVARTTDMRLVQILSQLGQKLAEGELLQLYNIKNNTFSYDVYYDIIRNKTATLFSSCTRSGAIAAGAADAVVEELALMGEYIGLAFQIKDDIFDYYNDETIGKPTGNDMREGKLTLPVLYAINSTEDKQVAELARRICAREASLDEIAYMVNFTKDFGGIEYAQNEMLRIKNQALAILDKYPAGEVADALRLYIDYAVRREL